MKIYISWRKMGARASLVTSMIGMTTVLTSVIFFFVEDPSRRMLGVAAGLLFLALSVYYAAHPFLRDERSYPELRQQVQQFIDLTRELHYAAIRGDDEAFESIKERVPDQVEMLIEAAQKSRPPDPVRVEKGRLV